MQSILHQDNFSYLSSLQTDWLNIFSVYYLFFFFFLCTWTFSIISLSRLACGTAVRVPSCWWTRRWSIPSPSRLTLLASHWKPSRSPARLTWPSSPVSNASPPEHSEPCGEFVLVATVGFASHRLPEKFKTPQTLANFTHVNTIWSHV